jgi:hypothetical protein
MGSEVLVKHNLITKIIAEETGGGGAGETVLSEKIG